MSRRFLIPLLLMVPAFVVAADPEPTDDAKRIQGTWEIVKASKGGMPPPESMKLAKFKFDAKTITITNSTPGEERPAAYKLTPRKALSEIDITPPSAEGIVKGIYKFEKDQLILVASKPGAERPTKFDDKSEVMLVLKRFVPKKKD